MDVTSDQQCVRVLSAQCALQGVRVIPFKLCSRAVVDSKKITELPYAQERKSSDRWGRSKCRATGLACGDIISQRLALDGLLALGVL